jgi:hypothetical protein
LPKAFELAIFPWVLVLVVLAAMSDHIGVGVIGQYLKAAAWIAILVELIWAIVYAVDKMCGSHQRATVAVEVGHRHANGLVALLREDLKRVPGVCRSRRGYEHPVTNGLASQYLLVIISDGSVSGTTRQSESA